MRNCHLEAVSWTSAVAMALWQKEWQHMRVRNTLASTLRRWPLRELCRWKYLTRSSSIHLLKCINPHVHNDVIVFNECLGYFPDPLSILRHYSHSLAPEGLILISM